MFQSRSGFSPCRDCPPASARPPDRWVSIPVWVFSLSRPTWASPETIADVRFQSRSGFSPCRDTPAVPSSAASACFNPGLGFLPVETLAGQRRGRAGVSFQSRSGFSPCRDTPVTPRFLSGSYRFNPGLGFLPVETRVAMLAVVAGVVGFNPGLGFLPVETRLEMVPIRVPYTPRRVSIPVWVFSLSRPPGPNSRARTCSGFQSRSGFSPCRDRGCKYGYRGHNTCSDSENRPLFRRLGLYRGFLRVHEPSFR